MIISGDSSVTSTPAASVAPSRIVHQSLCDRGDDHELTPRNRQRGVITGQLRMGIIGDKQITYLAFIPDDVLGNSICSLCNQEKF